MRHPIIATCCLGIALTLAGCGQRSGKAEVERAIKNVNAIDATNLNDIMLTAADPQEAVAYFRRASSEEPGRIDLQRGLAKSLVRAKDAGQAVPVYATVVAMKDATPDDQVAYADALIRTNDWPGAAAQLNTIPPTFESYERYRLEAMVADSTQQWGKADSFYRTAADLTTRPGSVLNNWGYSKLTRGDYREAERLFGEAVTNEPGLFTAKNNLILARAAQRKYDMPVIRMTQIEQAQLLHTLGLAAIKQGDVATGKGLLQEAVEAHPQYFEAAARALAALEANVAN